MAATREDRRQQGKAGTDRVQGLGRRGKGRPTESRSERKGGDMGGQEEAAAGPEVKNAGTETG
ncbi:hypothetical protein, partial [Salmonella enterica]|uniref:hypothetical protein n=1 Tax=Salmonella enterica TaxID=28901 RepID=UPI00398C4D39